MAMNSSLRFFVYERLPEPLLMFRFRRAFADPRRGLSSVGPYDADYHRNDIVHIGLIAEEGLLERARSFVNHLSTRYGYYKGFVQTFKVSSLVLGGEKEIKVDPSQPPDEILQVVKDAYFELAESLPDLSTVIIILRDEFVDKFYRRIKAFRFAYSDKTVRLQIIRKNTLDKAFSNDQTMAFTLFNVASAIYAKAGGTPWVLDKQLIPAGIFVGIAFTKPRPASDSNHGREVFYYGVFTVYNKYGRYIDMTVRGIRVDRHRLPQKHGTKGLYVPRNVMESVLRQVVSKYTPPIVIIHKSARFHRDEISAINNVLGSRDIDYALVHIESSNPYRGFGEATYDYSPVRGDLIVDVESRNRAILFTTGCTQSDNNIRRRTRPGTPRPLELEVEENTTPYTTRNLAFQVLALTKLDWNTTDLEVRMPVTTKYARRVSALTPYINVEITDVRDLI